MDPYSAYTARSDFSQASSRAQSSCSNRYGISQPSGLMARWENAVTKQSSKKMVPCDAATSEFQRRDYLKPQHLPASSVDSQCNYAPGPDISQTRFHRGFQRRHQTDIQQDAARLEYEREMEARRDARAQFQQTWAKELKEKSTFNILTGEGQGRDCEFRPVGKRINNPFGMMNTMFAEHDHDDRNRMMNSRHRFFGSTIAAGSPSRTRTLWNEGLTETKRQSVSIGYGQANPRSMSASRGVADNFAHLRGGMSSDPQWEKPWNPGRSQIVFGESA